MNVLLTNDDGVHSQGIRSLAAKLAPWASLWICAPKEQQSAMSHGITVRDTLRVRELAISGAKQAWSVEGRPADCVKIAILMLLPEPVDLVISGINEGSNLGTDTLYSGTVGAAMEAAMNGIPSMALSLALRSRDEKTWDFSAAGDVGLELFKNWMDGKLPLAPGSVLNVNVPDLPYGEIKGFRAARLGVQKYSDAYDLREEGEDGRSYYLLGERLPTGDEDLGNDLVAVDSGFVSLTPLTVDRTDYALLQEMEKHMPESR